MPVPRLFESAAEQAEHWAHTLACLLGLGGPETRAALLAELVGEELPGVGAATVRERRAVGAVEADVVVRDAERRWAVAIWSTLAFDTDVAAVVDGLLAGLGTQGRAIAVVVTPDRREPDAVAAARAAGAEVRHKSWLRVRDWVQERPERGKATGLDLVLLTEAEYFLTPRVAELYRLEALMPNLPEALRPTLATAFFDLNDLSPAPLIERTDRVAFPRTGEPKVELALIDGALRVSLATAAAGPGFAVDGDRTVTTITDAAQYTAARSHVRAAARALLPARL
ncbi:MAG: hypothetical protein AB1416_12665 [Actinomycetota bacterium]